MLFQDFNWIRTSDLVAPWVVRNTDSQNLSTLSSYTKNSSRSVQATCYIIQQNTTNWREPEGRRPPTGGVIGVQWSGWSSVRTPMHSHKSGWSQDQTDACWFEMLSQDINSDYHNTLLKGRHWKSEWIQETGFWIPRQNYSIKTRSWKQCCFLIRSVPALETFQWKGSLSFRRQRLRESSLKTVEGSNMCDLS